MTLELPDRFTDEERFVLENGSIAPTVVETTADQLARITTAVDSMSRTNRYPVTVQDGAFCLDLDDGRGTWVSDRLSGTVNGPDVRNEYGEAFARLVAAVRGPVVVQTGQGQPLVVVQEREHFTLRYLVVPRDW
ncbi:hypothetical protein [Haloarchaeobius sp. DFWS5]|uniref:hypothetical protein n=1 Tax=Haloarchaeobius sp. DFWS5 TaxID=3446114 RepID=UPI003EBCB0CC